MNPHLTQGIELSNSVTVYLDWNDETREWECAPVTMDGGPLDMPNDTEGDLDRSQWSDADRDAARRADDTPAPTGEELIKLMADWLPGETQDAIINAAYVAKAKANTGSNDEELDALRDYVALLEGVLGYDHPGPAEPRQVSAEEIEAARTPKGGWKRDQLAAWGVPWPPPKNWRKNLIAGKPVTEED